LDEAESEGFAVEGPTELMNKNKSTEVMDKALKRGK
jgi:hypothetical protein